jgi:uncharacterized membrane protein YcaP (DUF421 family)
MEKEDISIKDIHRILFGEMPLEFFIEVIIRTAFLYLLLMLSMRFMGKRMASSLSRTEQVALVSLAAAIGMPLQAADRGLLPAVIIATIVVTTEKLISFWSYKNQRFEKRAQDKLDILVSDSVLELKIMRKIRISKERVFAQLRSEGLTCLGEVKRLYIEANGSFTLIKKEAPTAGLSLIPDWDKEYQNKQQKSSDLFVCNSCGNERMNNEIYCPHCNKHEWIPAVKPTSILKY